MSTTRYHVLPVFVLLAIALTIVGTVAVLLPRDHAVPCAALGTGPMPSHVTTCYEPAGD